MGALKQDQHLSAKERLEREYRITDLGDPDSLTSATLQFVVDNQFDRAIHELRIYQTMKSTFPLYRERTERHFDHCVEIVEAIRTKRQVPTNNMPAAKRQELSEKIFYHFHELKESLQRIGHIENELKIQDAKSTVWVLQAFFFCVFFVLVLSIAVEAWHSMGTPIKVFFKDLVEWLLRKIGI